jgi:integrase
MPARRRRPRGYIEELPSGSFRAVVYAGADPLTGRPHYLRETARTYDAAEVALTRLQGQVDEDRHPKIDITLGRAIEQWLEVAELEDTTRDRYEDLVRIYIAPTLGSLPAAKLGAELLERFYTRLQRCRRLCSGRPNADHTCRPLSSSTVRKIHFIISAALKQAVRWQHLGVNKAALAVAPSPAQTEPDPPTAAEAATILSESVGRRSRLGPTAVAHDGHRLPPRRDQRPALDARRLRQGSSARPAEQCPAKGGDQGEGDEDPAAASGRT